MPCCYCSTTEGETELCTLTKDYQFCTFTPQYPLSADQSTSSGSSPSKKQDSQLSRWGDWLRPSSIGSWICMCLQHPWDPWLLPQPWLLCAHSLCWFCHGMGIIHHHFSVHNSWNSAYNSWSRVPGLRTCVSGLMTSAFGPGIDLSSGIDQDPAK